VVNNIGRIDRILRIFGGLILILLPFLPNTTVAGTGLPTVLMVAVGVILLVTALARFCPIYKLLGVATRRD